MLQVPTFVADSAIAGKGLFAGRAIRKGEVIWTFVPGFDRRFPEADFDGLSAQVRAELQYWGYFNSRTRHWILCGDEARRMNHADVPNLAGGYATADSGDEGFTYASRDIASGEELTEDYRSFDGTHDLKLGDRLERPSGG